MKPFHPFARIFPALPDAELESLAADIAMEGLAVPILLYNGQVLDGQNRERACEKAQIPLASADNPLGLRYEVFEGTEAQALAKVVSLNLKRRHLDDSQRAMVAARLTGLELGSNQHEQKQALKGPSQDGPSEQDENIEEDYEALGRIEGAIATAEAARLMDVSTAQVERARDIIRRGTPTVIAAVDAGILPVKTADEHVIETSSEEQDAFVAELNERIVAGRTPEQALKKIRGTQGTGENEWYTPDDELVLVRAVLGDIELDPASSQDANERVRAARFFDMKADGLARSWTATSLFLNPPYAQPFIAQFVTKLIDELALGGIEQAILLTHNYTDTSWFQAAAAAVDAICFTRGRIRFYSPNGAVAAPTQGQAFFYFGPNAAFFGEVFAARGFVVGRLT